MLYRLSDKARADALLRIESDREARRARGCCVECGTTLVSNDCPNRWRRNDGWKVPPRGKHSGAAR